MNTLRRRGRLNPASYGVAGILTLIYTWYVSLTELRETGMQFVAPLLVLFIIHTVWCVVAFGVRKNTYFQILWRTLHTVLFMLLAVLIFSILIPEPAHGSSLGSFGSDVATVLICLLMILMVGATLGAALYLVFLLVRKIFRVFKPQADDDNNSINEFASIGLTACFLLAASLEGVNGSYAFESESVSSASQLISASEPRVWETLETATRPEFPIPAVLAVFPRPVAVPIDEGVGLHAKRVVTFKGREGEGELRLQVTHRTSTHVTFQVLSDSSPLADWIAHKTLTYRVEPKGAATQLTVELEYERLLAPAWFFNSVMGGAGFLAMDVLAQDVKKRAELNNVPDSV